MLSRAEMQAELRMLDAAIDAAYWTFTRCARGKPPVLVLPPGTYERRNELRRLLWAKPARTARPPATR